MDLMEMERIIKLGMKSYISYPSRDIKDILDNMSKTDKDRLIAGLVYRYYEDTACVKEYKKVLVDQANEIKQLNEELISTRGKNTFLQIENKRLSIAVENSNKKNLSYREDVDIKTITYLLQKGYSKSEVAKKLGVSRQTIYRRLEEKGK